MRTLKIALFIILIAVTSCSQYIPKSQYEEILDEYLTLKEATSETQENYVKQSKAMDAIFVELSTVSRKTVNLKSDIEIGQARMTQAEQIENSINDIKDQLAELERLASNNKELQKTISNLKQVIVSKEEEIRSLKDEISHKDETISSQKETISNQKVQISSQERQITEQLQTIKRQKQELVVQVNNQAKLLYQAGVDFEMIADASPEIKMKSNKTKVQNWTKLMYEKSASYLQSALDNGYSSAREDLARVRSKLNELD